MEPQILSDFCSNFWLNPERCTSGADSKLFSCGQKCWTDISTVTPAVSPPWTWEFDLANDCLLKQKNFWRNVEEVLAYNMYASMSKMQPKATRQRNRKWYPGAKGNLINGNQCHHDTSARISKDFKVNFTNRGKSKYRLTESLPFWPVIPLGINSYCFVKDPTFSHLVTFISWQASS